VITVPKRYGQTDKETIYCDITALCVASRGKNSRGYVIIRVPVSRLPWQYPVAIPESIQVSVDGVEYLGTRLVPGYPIS